MKLSTKGRYAVTAMVDLVLHEHHGPVALADIAECQQISQSYLEQLFARLKRAGLVRGIRGPGGGYRLARGCDRISVAEVIDAVEGPAGQQPGAQTTLGREPVCCLAQELWSELGDRVHQCLSGISLADLCRTPAFRASAECQDRRMGRDRPIRAMRLPRCTSMD